MTPTFYFDVEKAMVDAINSQSKFNIPFGFPDNELTTTPESLWGQLHNINGPSEIVTIGDCGETENPGIFQIDVSNPKGNGSGAILNKVGEIADYFTSNRILVYNNVRVRLTTIYPGPRLYVGGYYRVPLTLNYRVRS